MITKFKDFLVEANISRLRCKNTHVQVFEMFLSPDPKDKTTLYTITDHKAKTFPLSNDGSVFYWDDPDNKTQKKIFNCDYMDQEKLEKPHKKGKMSYYAGIFEKKFVVMDDNNNIVISAKSFDDLMYEIVEAGDKYQIEDFPKVDSKDGYDAYSEYNSDYYDGQ